MTHTTLSAITNGAMTMRAPRFFSTTFILASHGAELNIIPTRSDVYRSTSQKWLGVLLAAADSACLSAPGSDRGTDRVRPSCASKATMRNHVSQGMRRMHRKLPET